MSRKIVDLLKTSKKVNATKYRSKNQVTLVSQGASQRLKISHEIAEWLGIENQIFVTVVDEGIILSYSKLNDHSSDYKVTIAPKTPIYVYSRALVKTIIDELNIDFENHTSKVCSDLDFIDEGDSKAVLVIF